MKSINFLRLNNEEKQLRMLARQHGCAIKSDAKETYIGKNLETENLIFDSIDSAVVDFVNHRVFDNEAITKVFIYDSEAKECKEIDEDYLDLIFEFVEDEENFVMYIDNGDKVWVLGIEDFEE